MPTRPSSTKMTAQRDRHDFGALEQRVYGAERKIDDLSSQFSSQMSDLRRDLSSQIGDLSKDFKSQQALQLDNVRTKWAPIIGTAATLGLAFVTVFGVVGSMALTPIRSDVADGKTDRKDMMYALEKKIDDINIRMTPLLTLSEEQKSNLVRFEEIEKSEDLKWSKDAQAEYEKRIDGNIAAADKLVSLEHEYDQRDFGRLLDRVNALDGELIKRPEIQAIDNGLSNRIDATERSAEDIRKEIGSAYTWGDEIKSLESKVELLSGRIFSSLTAPTIAPIAPIAPLAPVAPTK
jgi:hypothetical protein